MQWAAEAKGSQLTDAEDEIEEIEAELEKEKGRHQKVRQAVTDHPGTCRSLRSLTLAS